MLFDTHAHYTDEKFGNPTSLIDSLFRDDICGILCVGTDEKTSRDSLSLAKKYNNMYAAAGIHPHECAAESEKHGGMQNAIETLLPMLSDEKTVALGEIGLDYYYDFSPRQMQKEFFDAQITLSEQLRLPIVIHDREAHGDVLDIVKAHPDSFGIIHSCSCSAEHVKEFLKRNYFISFSGSLTFKNASKLLEAAKVVPIDRILVETDCPYLAPVPMRGKINHSGYMKYTAQKAAELLGVEYDEFCRREVENAHRIFNIKQ